MSLEGSIAVFLSLGGAFLENTSRLGLAFVCLGITEIAFPAYFQKRKIQPAAPKFEHVRHEVVHSVQTLVGGALIAQIFKFGIDHGFINLLSMDEQAEAVGGGWPAVVARWLSEVFLYFLIFDAYFYFGHRLFHTKHFWFIHKSHHVSKSPNAISGFSFNPIEGNIFGTFLPIYTATLSYLFGGMLKATLIACAMIQLLQTVFIHCGYEVVGASHFENKILSFFLTATFHDRHHEHPNCNFSGFFTWLDNVFGTADKNWRLNYASWRRNGRESREKVT
jgi:lathosterol oxidase